jgi:TolB-like protein
VAPEVERKLAAILSADVVGYSRLMALDEAGTIGSVKAHRDLIAALTRRHGGRVVDALGDNVLADFPSAVDAVLCGVAIQKQLAARSAELPRSKRMLWRLGITLGDVVVDGERIYGEGVNLAARIQELADPGSVTISGAAFDHVEGKFGLRCVDLGEHEVKNVPRPLRVYRVETSAEYQEETAFSVPGFSGRPTIAVLPFDNMSGDPEQEYFADGIVEDLITRLSCWRLFPVIARNSSFTYKGRSVDVQRVSRELGARYVIEGSVRRAGDRVRITAQLIDATAGHHVWAQRYDREHADVFAMQDELCELVVGSLHEELVGSEHQRAMANPSWDLDAWDCWLRGVRHFYDGTEQNILDSRDLFERALELDPGCARAHAWLSFALYDCVRNGWGEAPGKMREAMVREAERAYELDCHDPSAITALGMARWIQGRTDAGIELLESAVAMDPCWPDLLLTLGGFLAVSGRAEEAIHHAERAIRLSPCNPNPTRALFNLALAQFAAGRDGDCVETLRRLQARRTDDPFAQVLLAAAEAHSESGRAERILSELSEVLPGVTLALVRAHPVLATADPTFVDRLVDGLRRAGMEAS